MAHRIGRMKTKVRISKKAVRNKKKRGKIKPHKNKYKEG